MPILPKRSFLIKNLVAQFQIHTLFAFLTQISIVFFSQETNFLTGTETQ